MRIQTWLQTVSELSHAFYAEPRRGDVLQGDEAAEVLAILRRDAEQAYDDYASMLNDGSEGKQRDDRVGLARELARMNLSLNYYTQWYWKTDLHNLMGFLRLRADAHAQYEIRAYADVMMDVMAAWVPLAHAAFLEYRLGAVQLSATGAKAVRRMIAGEKVSQEDSGLTKREWTELLSALQLDESA